MEKEEMIRKEIVMQLIIEHLYQGIELNNNTKKLEFDRYNLDSKQLLFLLGQLDKDKLEATRQMLIASKERDED